MKNASLFLFLLCICIESFAQDFPGTRSGNYSGVNGVFFNPANIADNRYNKDINLFSIHAGFLNNNGSAGLKNSGQVFKHVDSVLFSNAGKNTSGAAGLDIFGPSVMLTVNKNTSVAFTTRVRAMTTFSNLDGNFIHSINNNLPATIPVSINSNGKQRVSINGWADFGISLGRVLLSDGDHFIKGGITLKYLAGWGNSYIGIDQMKGTLNSDAKGNMYMTSASGTVAIGHAGIDLDDFHSGDAFKFNGNGVGADIGFVYEYRPAHDPLTKQSENKYKFKIGIALLDIGALKYKPAPGMIDNYSLNVSNTQQWYTRSVSGLPVSKIVGYLNNNPYFTKNSSGSASYKVSLPATLQVNTDYTITEHYAVEAAGEINVADNKKLYNTTYYNIFSLTPRYDESKFSVYLPVSYNELSKLNAGIALRFGPLFIGSGSLFTALFDKSKQVDVHAGIHIGIVNKKQTQKKQTIAVTEVKPAVVSPAASTDTDKDGIIDKEDKCPTVPGLEKYSGCPIPDTDGDGVNDEVDKCPTIKGLSKNNGCPVISEDVIKKVTYAAKQIYFTAGKATILSKSFPALNDIVKILKNNPTLRLKIEGYTDNTGKAASNRIMSEKRALAVRSYFIGKGIQQSRLTYKGYGQDKPVADNKTAAGRAKNRRVELKIDY